MAAEATFLIRAVDSTKAAFASVQNNLDKLKNESQLAGGFLKKAFDFKQLGMGLAVAAGASLVSIVDKAIAQLDEFIKRSETARIGTIAAATDAQKIWEAGARERMSMEEQLAGLKQGEINAVETLRRLEKNQTIETRSFFVESSNGFMVLKKEKYRDLNLTKEQQKEYDEILVKVAQLQEAQKKLSATIDVGKKKKEQVIQMLKEKGYNIIGDDEEYRYLTKMPMDSVTDENVEKIFKEQSFKEIELETIKSTTVRQMWSSELDILREEYLIYKEERQRHMNGSETKKKSKVTVIKKTTKINSKKVVIEE